MTLLTGLSGCSIKSHFRKSASIGAGSNTQRRNKEKAALMVLMYMQIGFTVTLVPMILVVSLFLGGILNCSNYAAAYVTSFYLGMTNSLVNFVVYSVREDQFRSTVKSIFTTDHSSNLFSIDLPQKRINPIKQSRV
uniref:G-protein coupled receptors family 1 profile domain-containing protein n=1 Tax=Ciona savignyi TaxID=51511 RepID=H2YTG7_CIOSA